MEQKNLPDYITEQQNKLFSQRIQSDKKTWLKSIHDML